ncbi:MAG: hypothetical protein ACBZ72_01660 [Candidatus Bathyarchaeia archaeon]
MKYRKVRKHNRRLQELPRKGYRTICVTDKVYQNVQKKAKETNRTIPEYINYLLEKDDKQKT